MTKTELFFGLLSPVACLFFLRLDLSPDSVGEDPCGERMKGRHHSLLTPGAAYRISSFMAD